MSQILVFLQILIRDDIIPVSYTHLLLVSLTPASLGIREGIFSITSDILGINNEEIMQLALLDRGVSVINLVVLFGVLFGIRYLFIKYKRTSLVNKNKFQRKQ